MKKKLLEEKDKEFFDWLRLDVVDTKQAKLSRFKEHTETMKDSSIRLREENGTVCRNPR